MSQTPEMHTRMPTVGVQVDTLTGIDGSGVPFGSFASHWPMPPAGALHHCELLHSESTVHPLVQSPVLVLHTSPIWPWQSVSFVHMPHCPIFGPARKQNGAPMVEHGSCVLPPKSP